MVGLLLLSAVYEPFGPVFLIGVACIAALLVYEHSVVRPDDLSRVNPAFFYINALVSFDLLLLGVADLLL